MLEKEGAEVILPDFMGFVKFMATHKITFNSLLNINKTSAKISKIAIKLIDILEKDEKIALANSKKVISNLVIFALTVKDEEIVLEINR